MRVVSWSTEITKAFDGDPCALQLLVLCARVVCLLGMFWHSLCVPAFESTSALLTNTSPIN